MDEEIERLVISVRGDTSAFARDVAAMKAELDGPLAAGAERAGRALESALVRAVRTGQFGFEDLRRVALATMAEIASAAIRSGLGAIAGGGKGQGVGGLFAALLGVFGGAPGRATGGPVAPMRPYMVGERGPELFVPTAAGRIEPGGGGDVRVAITVNAPAEASPRALQASSRQVARAVRDALMRLD